MQSLDLIREFLKNWRDHLAWAAPSSPKINHQWFVATQQFLKLLVTLNLRDGHVGCGGAETAAEHVRRCLDERET